MKFLGFSNVCFMSKSNEEVKGINFYVSYPINVNNGQGEGTERYFLSEAKIERLNIVPSELIGQDIRLDYNRYGKISRLSVVKNDDSIDF